MTPENRIKYTICAWLRVHKCFFWGHDNVGIYDPKIKRFRANHNPYRLRGVSDILGIWRGRFLAIEVKTHKGIVSPFQEAFLDNVKLNGGIAIIARSVDDVRVLLEVGELPFDESS